MRITNVTMVNQNKLTFGDFNVFIGGNGVGKTTFLIELFHRISEITKNKWFWINTFEVSSNDVTKDMVLLKTSLGRKYEGANLFYYSNATKNIDGNVDISDGLRFSNTEYNNLDTNNDDTIFQGVRYRRPFVSFLSCEGRLGLNNEVGITSLDLPPQDSLNVLYRNKTLFTNIDNSILDRFNLHFILLSHTSTKLYIGVSKERPPSFNYNAPELQNEYENIEIWKDKNFIPITEAGHGIRSMIRLLTSLLEPVNQVIIIDEPEMHLYPSQKRWLGKQLVNIASREKKQVFLVTHDPMVLQGILDANTTTHIFRVDRDDNNSGVIKACELDRVTDVPAARNQEQYLQGLFYQRCIVVEGATDRSFYQNMFEDFPEIQDKDLGVVVSGGKSSSKHMAHIANKVGLNIAFIFDFDALLNEFSLINDIYVTLGGSGTPLDVLEQIYNKDDKVRQAKTNKDKYENIKKLTGYTEKYGISGQWAIDNQSTINNILTLLSLKGIFIVPKGTLESWAPEVEPKVKFAELAPDILRGNKSLYQPFKNFSVSVLKYLDINLIVE